MCGIAGYAHAPLSDLHLDHPQVLAAMRDRLIHRGPDAAGAWLDHHVALGHRRLSIIDLSGGAQPMESAGDSGNSGGGRYVIVFNGEIYNYLDLNKELAAQGLHARTRSDTETLLNAYAHWGIDCLQHLRGMFAFVLYDKVERRLFGARDPLGKKPLYYVHQKKFFAFASEPKALYAHPRVARTIDPQALALYLLLEYVPSPWTISQGMQKLEPGQWFDFSLDRGELRLRKFWNLHEHLPPTDAPDDTPWDLQRAQVRDALQSAVNRRLISDVPLGVFLSGGIDSGAIAAAMAKSIGGPRVRSFTIGFDDPEFDESAPAREIAQYLGTEHHEQRMSERDLLDALPTVVSFLDEPLADASILPTYLLAKFARQHVTVALGGDGGDEMFAGYQTFKALSTLAKYNRWTPAFVHRLASGLAARLPPGHGYFSLDFKIQRFLRGAKYSPSQRWLRWMSAFLPEEMPQLLSPDVLTQASVDGLQGWLQAVDHPAAQADPIARDAHLFARLYLADGVLVKVDRATMAASLEARSPLLDLNFVQFVLRLPSHTKVRAGRLKAIFRDAMSFYQWLPESITHRPKHGFAIPIARWLRGPLRDLLHDTLSTTNLQRHNLFNPAFVHRLLAEHTTGQRDHRKPLWTLFMFQRWYHHWQR